MGFVTIKNTIFFYFFQASNMQMQETGVCLNMAKKHPED